MSNIYRIIILIVGITVSLLCINCKTKSDFDITNQANSEQSIVYIDNTNIGMPIGYFIIIKRNNKYCALKLLECGKHKKKYYDGYVEYEFYHTNYSGNFTMKNANYGRSNAAVITMQIVGRLSFNLSNKNIECGDLNIEWLPCNGIGFSDGNSDESESETIKNGVEIAPTKWTNINDVNVFDDRLNWYQYDAKRKPLKVPVDEL